MISKVSLGTAQFGQDYGIANAGGKVPKAEVIQILDYAASVGIRCIDTAAAYGGSESVLGQYFIKNPGHFKVVSKLSSIESYEDGKVEELLKQSLQRLKIKRLYGCLLHRFQDVFINNKLWNDLIRLKADGHVEKIGFSLYSPDELVLLLENKVEFDIVQLPYSVFDHRFEKHFTFLHEKGIEVQVRSIFLQGLAFLGLDDLPASLQLARPQLENLQQIAREQNISVEALCLNFVLSNQHIDKVIIGVDSLAHLKNNMAGINFMDNVKKFYGQLSSIQIEREDILLPYKWVV